MIVGSSEWINTFLSYLSVKANHDIEEYSFGQTTLEQVFIEFAKQQEEADRLEEAGEMDVATERQYKRMGSVVSRESNVEGETMRLWKSEGKKYNYIIGKKMYILEKLSREGNMEGETMRLWNSERNIFI